MAKPVVTPMDSFLSYLFYLCNMWPTPALAMGLTGAVNFVVGSLGTYINKNCHDFHCSPCLLNISGKTS